MRARLALLIGVLAAVVVPATAQAGTVTTGASGLVIDTRLLPGGTPEVGTTLTFRLESTPGGLFWVVQSSKTLLAGGGCSRVGDTVARCPRQAEGVRITTGVGNDTIQPSGGLQFVDVVTADLGAGDDVYTGFQARDVVSGGDGADRLSGALGDDQLDGGDDNDQITGGVGRDTGIGGAGNDIFVDDVPDGTDIAAEDDSYTGGTGLDVVSWGGRPGGIALLFGETDAAGGLIGSGEGDTLRGIDRVFGADGPDRLSAAFVSYGVDLRGGQGDDLLTGGGGNDTVLGGLGLDTIRSGGGNDTIDAKAGEIVGGVATAFADPVIDCGAGSDLAVIDLKDDADPAGCEAIDRAPSGLSPDLVLPRSLTATRRGGAIRVPVSCTSRAGCRGTIAVKLGSRTGERTRYALKRGAKRTLRVAAPRTGRGSLVTSERDSRGRAKSSLRPVVVR